RQVFSERKVDLGKRFVWQDAENPCVKSGPRSGDFGDDRRTGPGRIEFIPTSQCTGTEFLGVDGVGPPHFWKIMVRLSIPSKDRKHCRTFDFFPAISQQSDLLVQRQLVEHRYQPVDELIRCLSPWRISIPSLIHGRAEADCQSLATLGWQGCEQFFYYPLLAFLPIRIRGVGIGAN